MPAATWYVLNYLSVHLSFPFVPDCAMYVNECNVNLSKDSYSVTIFTPLHDSHFPLRD